MILGQETPQECQNDSLKSYHHAKIKIKKLHLPRNEKIQSWCESTGQWELRSRKRSRNELRIYASCAPCEHRRAQDGWECWSMGHPCSIQRGLARRLCISPREKDRLSHEIKRYKRGVSPLGNGNCEAGSEAGMSCELCIVRTVRARKGARWVGVLEYGAPL